MKFPIRLALSIVILLSGRSYIYTQKLHDVKEISAKLRCDGHSFRQMVAPFTIHGPVCSTLSRSRALLKALEKTLLSIWDIRTLGPKFHVVVRTD